MEVFEGMRDALSTLKDAVHCLTSETSSRKDRLKEAMIRVCGLKPSQFPPAMLPEFLRLRDELCPDWRLAWLSEGDKRDAIRRKVEALKHGECIRATYAVLSLHSDLEAHLLREGMLSGGTATEPTDRPS